MGPAPFTMLHIKILAVGLFMLAAACALTAVVMALMAAVAWVMFHHIWVFYVMIALGLAYWLGMEYYANE